MTTYKAAGVDIAAKAHTVAEIQQSMQKTFNSSVLAAATTFKFGGVIDLQPFMQYSNPVLVLNTDGVGSKMIIAEMLKRYDTIGVDILHHNINDILTSGARPLFFLDYIASAHLNSEVVVQIINGIVDTCKRHNIILAGGETAEMPGIYHTGRYELTGTIGGVVEREKMIDGSLIQAGDAILGLASNGLHTNGYSLARKIFFEDHHFHCESKITGLEEELGEVLLRTHREYATAVLPLVEQKLVQGIAHITGGGFLNILRVLPAGLGAQIGIGSWDIFPIFKTIQTLGEIPTAEMLRTFNMGIGLVLIVRHTQVTPIKKLLNEHVYELGTVIEQEGLHYESD